MERLKLIYGIRILGMVFDEWKFLDGVNAGAKKGSISSRANNEHSRSTHLVNVIGPHKENTSVSQANKQRKCQLVEGVNMNHHENACTSGGNSRWPTCVNSCKFKYMKWAILSRIRKSVKDETISFTEDQKSKAVIALKTGKSFTKGKDDRAPFQCQWLTGL